MLPSSKPVLIDFFKALLSLSIINDLIPANLKDMSGKINTEVKFKSTSAGIQDYFNKDQKLHTLVKYDCKVGDQYQLKKSDGAIITRTVKAVNDDFPYGSFLMAKTTLIEQDSRWEIKKGDTCYEGIDETMSIDNTQHSLFGASKIAADILVQEYGRYFHLNTACFRSGCVAGPYQSAVELHGFLTYLMKCAVIGREYTIFGYRGKQVRDVIHSYDLISAFYHFYQTN